MNNNQKLEPIVIAIPKGRIWNELSPLMAKVGIIPEAAFNDPNERKLLFKTNFPELSIIRVRSFDVATFVAFGAAQLGISGSDVLAEFDYEGLYAPVDLGIGKCRLSVAELADLSLEDNPLSWSHVRIATKYPNLTRKYFAKRGVQTECIKLNGAMELAPKMGLCRRIVDLVSSGQTLKENGLVEIETIMNISSKLIVHRASLKTMPIQIQAWIDKFSTIASK